MAHRSTDTVQNERTKKMEHTKLMPRHLLLLLLPIASALVGGMLFSGNSSAFFRSVGGRGISQAQLFLGLALLSGALALGIRYLPHVFRAAIIIFMPLLYALAVMPQLGPKQSLAIIYALNLAITLGLWAILRFIFFRSQVQRLRTAVFAFLAALVLTLYFRALYLVLGMPFLSSQWSGFYWNSLFLFIFVGFGLSIADVAIIRKDYADRPPLTLQELDELDKAEEEEEEDSDA